MTRAPRSALAVVIFAVACGSSSEPTAPLSNDPSFSAAVKGDVSASLQGFPLSIRLPTGYSESTSGGPIQSTPVVMISFGARDAGRTSVSIGLMGPIQPGTYVVRTTGSSPLGSRPELYGSILQTDFDGTHNYSATSGTVTLTSAGTTLRGTFSLHYGRVVLFPTTPAPGTSYPSTPASVDATGSFAVAAPTQTIP